jgi:hypothetical protein
MNKLVYCLAAAAPLAFASAGAAAPFEEVAKEVKVDAFSKADKGWRRLMVNRNSDCGEIGKSGVTRLDVIIKAYEPLASAVAAGDSATAMTAGSAFAQKALQNPRYASCWETVAHRVGLSAELPSLFD